MGSYTINLLIGLSVLLLITGYIYLFKRKRNKKAYVKIRTYSKEPELITFNMVAFMKDIYLSLHENTEQPISGKYFYASDQYMECKSDPTLLRELFLICLKSRKNEPDSKITPTIYIQNRKNKIGIQITNSTVSNLDFKEFHRWKRIMQLQGGDFWVENEYQNKSIFTIFIPKYPKREIEDTPNQLTHINPLPIIPRNKNKIRSSYDQTHTTFIRIIEENIDNPQFDVNNLVKESGLSRTSLYTKLKTETGLTPKEFILKVKLEKAAHLLINNPELQIQEISIQLGFNSTRCFARWFKNHFHCTPVKYRKKNR